jgi:MoxR-like ATPase
MHASETLRSATRRFVAFFCELGEAFVEREDAIVQIALALLSREHVLMTGPPGTAKSRLAQAVLGRIVSEETGQPSLFARQFTESTVQTDLVGPIDFKTLMDTGRTEHFTDEGMLGAVHAFLDEVFDGRDMLLRSALNLLNEREVKQGTRITRGKIECALMTSNRYLAEVLENERLLAFVDRIAYLCFVPKGFASPKSLEQVLLAQVAGRKPRPLKAPLTIGDLDVLQDAVERIFIEDGICGRLASLVQKFESEMATARRADPTFVPSRYLSTRTVVRMGALLRAACFWDWALRDGDRALEVEDADLAWLRLGLTLAGPSPKHVASLLEHETDPRERRQLAIIRTEREIFDRCLDGLPAPARRAPLRSVDRSLLEKADAAALRAYPTAELSQLAEQLAKASTAGQVGADEAASRLDDVLREIVDRALSAGLLLGSGDSEDPVTGAIALANLADTIEQADAAHQKAAQWLRGRVLTLVHQIIHLGAMPLGQVLADWQASAGDLAALESLSVVNLRRAEQLADLRKALRHAGALEPKPGDNEAIWKRGIESLAERLSTGLAPGVAAAVKRASAEQGRAAPAARLQVLAPIIAVVQDSAKRLEALGGSGSDLRKAVLGAPLRSVAETLLTAEPAGTTRGQVVQEIEGRLARLAEAGVLEALSAQELVSWMATTLLRARPAPGPAATGKDDDALVGILRGMIHASSLAYDLIQLSLRALPELRRSAADPDQIVASIASLVSALPPTTREGLAKRDLQAIDDTLTRLEQWWTTLSAAKAGEDERVMQTLVRSRFLELTQDQGGLMRVALEARLVGEVFRGVDLAPLLARVERLSNDSAALATRLLGLLRTQGSPARNPPQTRT